MSLLAGSVYDPARKQARITMIEDVPQVDLPSYTNRTKLTIPTFNRDSVSHKGTTITPASDQTSDASSLWSNRSSQSSFDSLYDVTEDEGEEIPIKLSASVKRHTREARERSRYPSLVIPSPSKWPTIQKLQSPCTIGLSPASKIAVTPAALATYNAMLLNSPAASSAPSLDGSLTSEELSNQSCPSTPELGSPNDSSDGEWDQPIQLDPQAFEVLHHLQPETADEIDTQPDPVITISDEAIQEMQEIVRDAPVRHDFPLSAVERRPFDSEETISALSVPSPGGFFSSLAPCAAQTWARRTPEPTTSFAENFYGVPWRAGTPPDLPTQPQLQPNLRLAIPKGQSNSPVATSPVPALYLVLSPSEKSESSEITEVTELSDSVEYTASYEQALSLAGLEHSDRTKLWLHAQATYLARLCEDVVVDRFKDISSAIPTSPASPVVEPSSAIDASSPSKKSVRFVDGLDSILAKASKDSSIAKAILSDPIFYHAFQHINRLKRNRDAFIHAQARAEAVHVERSNIALDHCKQLTGHYKISTPVRPSPVRPISNMLPNSSDSDALKEIIATAERERQALEQIKASAWCLEAERQLYGGKLLNSPAEKRARELPSAKILDYGGQPAGDWGWQIALDYENANVYTVPMPGEDEPRQTRVKGPSNHRVVNSARPWVLPFPNATFDIISARTMHMFLKASTPTPSPQSPISPRPTEEDQWDLALCELYRVLKPGGYLEFAIYDASLLHPGSLGRALSVEFCFNLRTRSYDPFACTTFLPRLRKIGFSMLRRGWLVLPMADVRPRWTDAGKAPGGMALIGSGSGGGKRSSTNFYHVEKKIGDDGQVEMYEPPLTGSTAAVQAMTGLVGARAWEQWMLKVGAEMGRSEEVTMEQISRVLEEGGKEGSGWKCLMGWARK